MATSIIKTNLIKGKNVALDDIQIAAGQTTQLSTYHSVASSRKWIGSYSLSGADNLNVLSVSCDNELCYMRVYNPNSEHITVSAVWTVMYQE